LVLKTRSPGAGTVVVEVEDSGPGVHPDLSEKIFDAFVTTTSTGKGPGLAICQRIIERHGGQISASAAQPHGSVFRVMLPPQSAGQRNLPT
jgi:signal transduction histidine kinase